MSTLRSLLLQCEQYPRVAPVVPTQLHKGLKCKRKINEDKEQKKNKNKLQVSSKVLILAEQYLFPAIRVYQEASRMHMNSWYTFLIRNFYEEWGRYTVHGFRVVYETEQSMLLAKDFCIKSPTQYMAVESLCGVILAVHFATWLISRICQCKTMTMTLEFSHWSNNNCYHIIFISLTTITYY